MPLIVHINTLIIIFFFIIILISIQIYKIIKYNQYQEQRTKKIIIRLQWVHIFGRAKMKFGNRTKDFRHRRSSECNGTLERICQR